MQSKRLVLLVGLAATISGCVPLASYQALQRENDALKVQTDRNHDLARKEGELADRTTALAQQNIDLKMDKAALMQQAREKEAQYDAVARDLSAEVSAGRLKITRYKDMLTLDVADEILFDSAKAHLKAAGQEVLRSVGKALAKSNKTIRVVGHTDDQPLAKGAAFASNWELSTARATTVVRFLQDQCGLDPRQLLAAGRGQWMPEASNATPAGRQLNRRIEITLLDHDLLDDSEAASHPVTLP